MTALAHRWRWPVLLMMAAAGVAAGLWAVGIDPDTIARALQDGRLALQHQLSDAMAGARGGLDVVGAAGALGIGFGYGVLHALGPGHGKAVVSTYVLGAERRMRRAVGLAVASALVQGLVAIVLILGASELLGLTRRETFDVATWVERGSYGLVALLGLWIAGRGLWGAPAGHDNCAVCAPGQLSAFSVQDGELRDRRTWWAALGTVGIRPCSGALLVLVLGESLDLRWLAVAVVVAMSLGTALAVAGLAGVVSGAREAVMRLFGDDEHRVAMVRRGVSVVAGLGLTTLGVLLLVAASGPKHPLL
ncbi:MAG: nickel transporter [Gammaproteobacteria bacterium]|uniref:nickel/cobalt transporter n=1 Tax=Thalassobaculum sp. TaxID=2022740 RepID=UPI0032ED34CE